MARRDGYRSRAAFKLMEIDDKFHLTENIKCAADLGAAPGGWCQVLSQRSSADTKIVASDLAIFDSVDKVEQIVGDFEDEDVKRRLTAALDQKADLIVSDMAPSVIGHAATDHIRIMRLAEAARLFAEEVLKPGGAFVVKVFRGGGEKAFLESLKKNFRTARFFKPESSRDASAEIYAVATGFAPCD
jgi:23S rRNA (uridine2552-2'-O)-methyltransferase